MGPDGLQLIEACDRNIGFDVNVAAKPAKVVENGEENVGKEVEEKP
jgi:hypothetical protein